MAFSSQHQRWSCIWFLSSHRMLPSIWTLQFSIAVTRNKRRTRNQVASEWVKKMSIRSWLELHFTTISHILSFNYSYRYEIDLIRIMYTANSLILYSKDKTVRILGTWHQYLVNVSGIRSTSSPGVPFVMRWKNRDPWPIGFQGQFLLAVERQKRNNRKSR